MSTLYLKYLKGLKSTDGFTLIELLVVIIIIGILSAIALPSFLNQASKAKQVEAKQYLSAITKAQQAYYLENNAFTTQLGKLAIGIKNETVNYSYSLAPINNGGGVVAIAAPQEENSPIKGYISGVGLVYQSGASDPTTLTVLCESVGVGVEAQLKPSDINLEQGSAVKGGNISCGDNTIAVK